MGSRSFLACPLTHPPCQLARVLLLTCKFGTVTLPSTFCYVTWSRVVHNGSFYCTFAEVTLAKESVCKFVVAFTQTP